MLLQFLMNTMMNAISTLGAFTAVNSAEGDFW